MVKLGEKMSEIPGEKMEKSDIFNISSTPNISYSPEELLNIFVQLDFAYVDA